MLRRRTDEADPKDWFWLAGDRLRGADVIWKSEGLTATGIENLQEAVERYPKGYLIACGWRLVKTHDLQILLRAAEGFDSRFASFYAIADKLTEDFFAQHYPGSDLTRVGEGYEEMRRAAGEMVALIHELLPQHFPTK